MERGNHLSTTLIWQVGTMHYITSQPPLYGNHPCMAGPQEVLPLNHPCMATTLAWQARKRYYLQCECVDTTWDDLNSTAAELIQREAQKGAKVGFRTQHG